MDFFQDCISDPPTLRQLNHCCLSLKLFWLSEVLTTQGDQIDQHVLNGKPSQTTESLCHWPRQGPPSRADWHVWRSTLLSTLCHLPTHPNAEVVYDLGDYILHWMDPSHPHYRWKVLWDPAADRVYTCPSSAIHQWQMWLHLPSPRRSRRYHSPTFCDLAAIPLSSLRATIRIYSPQRLILLSNESPSQQLPPLPSPTTKPSLPLLRPPFLEPTISRHSSGLTISTFDGPSVT